MNFQKLIVLFFFVMFAGCSLPSADGSGGSDPSELLVGYWVNESTAATRVAAHFDGGTLTIYYPQETGSTQLTAAAAESYTVQVWEDQPCDCWILVNSEGSGAIAFSDDRSEFEFYQDGEGGFYVFGGLVATDSALFSRAGDEAVDVESFGVTLAE